MPALTDPSRPSGLPMASTVSPTCRSALLPSVAGVRPLTSVGLDHGQVGGRVAAEDLGVGGRAVGERDASVDPPSAAWATTWLLVRIWPSELMTMPEPLPAPASDSKLIETTLGRTAAAACESGSGALSVSPADPARQARHRWCRGVVVERQCDQRAARGRHEHQARGGEHRHGSPAPPRGRRAGPASRREARQEGRAPRGAGGDRAAPGTGPGGTGGRRRHGGGAARRRGGGRGGARTAGAGGAVGRRRGVADDGLTGAPRGWGRSRPTAGAAAGGPGTVCVVSSLMAPTMDAAPCGSCWTPPVSSLDAATGARRPRPHDQPPSRERSGGSQVRARTLPRDTASSAVPSWTTDQSHDRPPPPDQRPHARGPAARGRRRAQHRRAAVDQPALRRLRGGDRHERQRRGAAPSSATAPTWCCST